MIPICAISLLDSCLLTDELHMAQALYMLNRAVAGRYVIPDAEMHGLLRDAAMHCEAARLHWTKEECERIDAIGAKIGIVP